jgi:hypothetical protein
MLSAIRSAHRGDRIVDGLEPDEQLAAEVLVSRLGGGPGQGRRQASRRTGTTPEQVLIGNGSLSHDQLARALAERYGLDHVEPSVYSVDMAAANLVASAAAKRYQAVPVAFADKQN